MSEVPLYGSQRLGIYTYPGGAVEHCNECTAVSDISAGALVKRTVGRKNYELTDHLGNVRAVVADVKREWQGGLFSSLQSAAHYYPFGMEQPSRTYQSGDYRYGYNGKEKDDEVKGSGNSYDYGARIYDSRLGRWLSVDPKSRIYTGLSPYVFVANSVFLFREIDGAYFDINIPPPVFDLDRPKKNGKNVLNVGLTTVGVEGIRYNAKTKDYDVIVNIQIQFTSYFGVDGTGVLEKQNRGLYVEVNAHEYGHVDKIQEVVKANDYTASVSFNGKVFSATGMADEVMNKLRISINDEIDNSILVLEKEGKSKDEIKKVVDTFRKQRKELLGNAGDNIARDMQGRLNALTNKANFDANEEDANNRARKTLGKGNTPYIDREKPIILDGEVLQEAEKK